ncbi:MAG: cytochrome c oxidase subunit II [Microcystaceae cyanobacterium]
MKIPPSIITLLIGISITLISLWYGQNHGLMPVAASTDAQEVDGVFNFMMTIATGLFLLVEGVLVYSLIRFRRRKGDQTDGPPVEGNVPLEILWTAIPTIIVFILAVYSFEVYNNLGGLDPATSGGTTLEQVATNPKGHDHSHMLAMAPQSRMALGIGDSVDENGIKPLVVDVKGIQYAWIFSYPETGITSGELHAPVNRPVRLNISAGDVIHAVWIPQLRLKQDAIPGRDSTLVFKANKIGEYPVVCAELCGAYHGGMKAMFYSQTQEEFDAWVLANAPAPAASSEPVAFNVPDVKKLSEGEYLAPYAKEMGIVPETLAQVQAVAHDMI